MMAPSPFDLLVICRSGPYSDSRVSAGVDFLLTAASFEQKVTVCFMGDGLNNLLATKSESPAVKNPAKAIGAFELYGVHDVLVIDTEAAAHQLDVESLGFPVKTVTQTEVAAAMQRADQVMVY